VLEGLQQGGGGQGQGSRCKGGVWRNLGRGEASGWCSGAPPARVERGRVKIHLPLPADGLRWRVKKLLQR
jgi:hypothetical protein